MRCWEEVVVGIIEMEMREDGNGTGAELLLERREF
jgi:hypothetical protein